jgi:PAS domain S-box-containing protein
LWAEGNPEAAIRLEELWNHLARTHSFSLRCAYPITNFNRDEDGEPFLKICAAHSAVIPDESYTALSTNEERLRSISHLQQKVQALETAKTERTDAQNSLRRKQSELADLLENAVEGVQRVGADRKILWANRALLHLLGYSPGEYVGHQFSEFHVDENVFAEYWRRLMRGEDVYDCPAELHCKDGSVKQVQIYSNGLGKRRVRSYPMFCSRRHRTEAGGTGIARERSQFAPGERPSGIAGRTAHCRLAATVHPRAHLAGRRAPPHCARTAR